LLTEAAIELAVEVVGDEPAVWAWRKACNPVPRGRDVGDTPGLAWLIREGTVQIAVLHEDE
jgi:hypothetical protein